MSVPKPEATSTANLQFERAKKWVADSIAQTWRFYDDAGQMYQSEDFREDFAEQTKNLSSLSELWRFVSESLREKVRDGARNPVVNVHLSSGKSWQDYDLLVLKMLDAGEHLSLPDTDG